MSDLTPLIDRREELARLDAAWQSARAGRPQLVVLSGHRRVGKTFLLLHFLERVAARGVYYFATQQSEAVELARFAETVTDALGEETPLAVSAGLSSWEIALRAVAEAARDKPLVVVVDEAPYLTESTRGFASVVQAFWDDLSVRTPAPRLLLILTGSATSVVEEMVGPKGPLRGRFADHMRLLPFDLPTFAAALDAEPDTAVEAYAACGGWPLHLAAWDPGAPTGDNLLRLAGRAGGVLLEDADLILQDLPTGPGFSRVLAAIGRGRTRHRDIATEAGQRIDYPLQFLTDTGLVRRDTPVGAPQRARPLYTIADPYLRFWFAVCYPERQRIHGGLGAVALDRRIAAWRTHIGWVFEEAARAHARRLAVSGEFPADLEIGRWWTTSGAPLEVDVVGMAGRRTALVGEATWSRSEIGVTMVQRLRSHLRRVPKPVAEPLLAVWTRGRLGAAARAEGIRGYGVDDVVRGSAGSAGV